MALPAFAIRGSNNDSNVTPTGGTASTIVTGGTSVIAVPAFPAGGFITNPISAAGQGIGAAESLFINPVGTATTTAGGATFELGPGATWTIIPGQTTATSVNAVTSGHNFSVVCW